MLTVMVDAQAAAPERGQAGSSDPSWLWGWPVTHGSDDEVRARRCNNRPTAVADGYVQGMYVALHSNQSH